MLDPSVAELLQALREAHSNDIHTSTVCRVEKYDAIKQVVDCVPVIRRPLENSDGDVEHEEICVLPNVPVAWPRAGGFFLHMPLAVGDHVLVVFTHDNIAGWRQTGSVSDPGDRRRHSLASCVAIPGVAPMLEPLTDLPLPGMSPAEAVLGGGGYRVGNVLTADYVVLITPLLAHIAKLQAALVALQAAHAANAAVIAGLLPAATAPAASQIAAYTAAVAAGGVAVGLAAVVAPPLAATKFRTE